MNRINKIYASLYVLSESYPMANMAIKELDELNKRERKLTAALRHSAEVLESMQNTIAQKEAINIRKLIGDNHA